MVKFGAITARVPDEFVAFLVNNEDDTGLQQIELPHMEAGDKVRIIDGAMAGLEAVYQCEKGEERALIMLEIAGKLARVELAREQLEKAD